jgi:hypothetical protein
MSSLDVGRAARNVSYVCHELGGGRSQELDLLLEAWLALLRLGCASLGFRGDCICSGEVEVLNLAWKCIYSGMANHGSTYMIDRTVEIKSWISLD